MGAASDMPQMKVYGVFGNAKQLRYQNDGVFQVKDTAAAQAGNNLLILIVGRDRFIRQHLIPNLAGCLPVQWDFGTVLSEYKKSPGILPTFLVGFIALGRLQHNFCHFSGAVKQKIFYYIKFFNAKFSCIG